MKKAAIILALLLVCNLMGCGVTETAQMAGEESGEAVTESVSEVHNAASADAEAMQAMPSELEEQLTVLAKNRKQWLSHNEYTKYGSLCYTVTDLNQNGRLEIVTHICMGGMAFGSTYYHVDEVTKNGTVEEWQFKGGNDEYTPRRDIGDEMTTVYYNEEEGTYAYSCNIHIHSFDAGYLFEPGYIMVDQMMLEEKGFDCYFREGNEYYDGEGNSISNKEYDKLVAEATPEGEKGHAYFRWEWSSVEELSALSEQELKAELTELFQGFVIQFKQKNDKSYKKQIQYLVAQRKALMELLSQMQDNETDALDYELMVMDLNQNGQMELEVLYGDKKLVLEVNKEGDGFTQWNATGEMPNYYMKAYRSSKDDAVHFVCRVTDEADKERLLEGVITDGQMTTQQVCSLVEETDDDDNVISASYYDGEDKAITKQEYDSIEQAFYKPLAWMTLYIPTIASPARPAFKFKELEQLTDEELTDMLEDGMECFVLE